MTGSPDAQFAQATFVLQPSHKVAPRPSPILKWLCERVIRLVPSRVLEGRESKRGSPDWFHLADLHRAELDIDGNVSIAWCQEFIGKEALLPMRTITVCSRFWLRLKLNTGQ